MKPLASNINVVSREDDNTHMCLLMKIKSIEEVHVRDYVNKLGTAELSLSFILYPFYAYNMNVSCKDCEPFHQR